MIRLATLHDVDTLVDMVEEFVLAEMANPPKPDKGVIKDTVLFLVKQQNKDGMAAVYEVDGEIYGLVLGMAIPSMFSLDISTLEIALYVKPEYRKSRAGLSLLKTYEDWSKEIALADDTCLASLDHRLSKLYERRGYFLTEQSYRKRNK